MKSPESYPGRTIATNQVLLASGARVTTAGSFSDPVTLDGFAALVFQLDVTAAATDAGDTLDATIQTTLDGTNWVDIHHFTQVLGNGGAKRYYGKVVFDAALTEFENGAALAAAAGRSIFGSQYRVKYVIVNTSTEDASFTFSVVANAT